MTITTPFSYPTGINYESWTMGRSNRSISADLDMVTQNFKLIKTFHGAAVGTQSVLIDPTQVEVINYITSKTDLVLAMGTNNSALAVNANGWGPGLMTQASYTDSWVTQLIDAFGSVSEVKRCLQAIFLGNEVDANGPPSSDAHFSDYYQTWIPSAQTNLTASLSAQGLDGIPVTTIIANYPSNPRDNPVAVGATSAMVSGWQSGWNGGEAFVMFNQYTPNYGKSTDFTAVENYFNNLVTQFAGSPQVFVGETGYSAENGEANEAKVIGDVFSWLAGQGSPPMPLFVFQSFDHSAKPTGQQQMGLYAENSADQPTGLKSGITVPSWVSQPI